MNYEKLNTWVKQLENSKPYRIVMKNGRGFYDFTFLYGDYHYNEKLNCSELDNDIECQKKILKMCTKFEQNMKLRVF